LQKKENKKFSINVQIANCLKEERDYDNSLMHYKIAESIVQNNSDLYLQMGHLYKMMGEGSTSKYYYQKSFNIDRNLNAFSEIENSGMIPRVINIPEKQNKLNTIWFDITDFMVYAKHNTSLSGIQRVCANLITFIENINIEGFQIVPVHPDCVDQNIMSVDMEKLLELIKAYDDVLVDKNKIDILVDYISNNKKFVYPSENDIFAIAGAFWIFDYEAIQKYRRKGMRLCLFLHDLIPIRHPEYVSPDATKEFKQRFSDILDITDVIIANSEYVAKDIKSYIEETKSYSIPIYADVLPTELRDIKYKELNHRKEIKNVVEKPYILCVSTIEIRKNHPLLVKIWEKLLEDVGDLTPNLVLVGKWGWQIDDFRKYIEEKGYVGDWLYIFNGISDGEMEFLYKNASFTIYPSFAEGFGLPIGESLVYGKPCISSNTTSMPEVGGIYGRYIDPFDFNQSYNTVKEYIIDKEKLFLWENDIKKNFSPKRWADFCLEFYRIIETYSKEFNKIEDFSLILLPKNTLLLGGDNDILNMSVEKKIS